jgi:outer membrane protein assembly factor BamB/enterochelin esterase-like enzyme
VRIALLLALCSTTVAFAQEAADYSEFRVNVADAVAANLPEEEFGLSVAWNRELGSGYSNVSIAGGKAVTMFTDGELDVLAAFDPDTGSELWRYELDEKYAGHDGSDDGPLSTPAISDDRVFALTPRGRLLAVSLDDGSEMWRRDLDEESSTPPFYGYTSSPITADDLVILATGGDGHAITAFDRDTGETRWASGDDSVRYQTPTLMELGGRTTLVAATDSMIQGFDPWSGERHFQLSHAADGRTAESSHVIPIDDRRFVVNFDSGSAMYSVTADGGIEEVWQSRAFNNSLAIPVLVDGHLYGFTGRFLTCAEADTGEIVWRSRPPLGQGIALVGGKLVVLAASGDLVVIEPTPEGYQELTRISTFEEGDYATATFSEGVFLVRNLERMAAIRVDTATAPQMAVVDTSGYVLGDMAQWTDSILALPETERQAKVDARFGDLDGSPVATEDGLAHFYWRGDAEDVGLESPDIDLGAENGFLQVAGTDLFLRSVELDPKGQYTYSLTVDYGDPALDPGNPYTVDNGFNVVSELRMPAWPDSAHLEEPTEDTARGALDTFPFRSEILDNTRQIQVWRPHGYGSDPEARYPLLVVNHGDNLLRGGLMRNTLDNLVGESVAPLIAVFVPRVAPVEYGGDQVDDYVRFLVEELLPHMDRHYLTDGESRAIMGPGSAGVTAVYTALKHSELFQQAAAQSFYPIEPAQTRFAEMIAAAEPGPATVHLVWSTRDYELGDGRRAEDASKELAEMLRQGGIDLSQQIADYSPGWGGWRGQHDDLLARLFPIEEEPTGP